MKQLRTLGVFVSASVVGWVFLFASSPSSAQRTPPIDPGAVSKTHVPHVDSLVQAGGSVAPDVGQANSPASLAGTPYLVGPTIGPTTTFPEAEEHIAVDLGNASNLVAAISDFALRGGYNTTKYVFSTNNGTTWLENYIPTDSSGVPVTGAGLNVQKWYANSDPVVAIDKHGYVYLSNLYLINANFSVVNNNANGVYVSVATFTPGGGISVNFTSGQTFPVVPPNTDPATTTVEDKPWIAVDNSGSTSQGRVYASWTHFANGSDGIYFSRSGDHGQTWSSPVVINPSTQSGGVQGSQVAVGPDGTVYVVYEVFYVGGQSQHFLAKSVDGGASFSAPVAVTPLFRELAFNSTYRKFSFSSLAVSPANGHVYVVYSDEPNASVGAEVEFVASANDGATFSAPVVVNNPSKGQQFMPAVAVDSAGVIHVSWFDTRNNPKITSLYDIYASSSSSDGAKFTSNARVTSTSANAGSSTFIGDYAGIAAGGGFAHPVWTSGGINNGSSGQLQTATLQ